MMGILLVKMDVLLNVLLKYNTNAEFLTQIEKQFVFQFVETDSKLLKKFVTMEILTTMKDALQIVLEAQKDGTAQEELSQLQVLVFKSVETQF